MNTFIGIKLLTSLTVPDKIITVFMDLSPLCEDYANARHAPLNKSQPKSFSGLLRRLFFMACIYIINIGVFLLSFG